MKAIETLTVPEQAQFRAYIGAEGGEPTFPVINVKNYGAVGDFYTDDTAAIQSAINALEVSTTIDTLYFPPGYYKVSTRTADTNTSTSSWRNLLLGGTSLSGRNILILGDNARIYQDNGSVRSHLFVVKSPFLSLKIKGMVFEKSSTMLSAVPASEPVGNDAIAFKRVGSAKVDLISYEDCEFNNFHGITFFYGVSYEQRGLIRKFVVNNCRLLNPFGANTINSNTAYGGGQQIRVNSLVDVAEITNNLCEGGSADMSDADYCQGGRMKDAIVFGDPRVLICSNNTIRYYGVEVVFVTANYNLMASTASSFVVPAVSSNVTVSITPENAGLTPSGFEAGQNVNFLHYSASPPYPAIPTSLEVVSWNGTNSLVVKNTGAGGTPGTTVPSGSVVYLDAKNDCTCIISNNTQDLSLPIGAAADSAPQGIVSSVRGVISGNSILYGATGIEAYKNITTPSVNQVEGLLVVGNFITTKDNTGGTDSVYGIHFKADGCIGKDNVILVPNPHIVWGINTNSANCRLTGNVAKALIQAANGYSSANRSVGFCVGNESAGSIWEGNHSFGFDVGIGAQQHSQGGIPMRIINHISTNDVLAFGESRTQELGAGTPGEDAPAPTAISQISGITLDLDAAAVNRDLAVDLTNTATSNYWVSRAKTPVYGAMVRGTILGTGPTYSTGVSPNGTPAITFAGVGGYTMGANILNIGSASEMTIIVACKPTALSTDTGSNYTQPHLVGEDGGYCGVILKPSGANNVFCLYYTAVDAGVLVTSSAVAPNTNCLVVATIGGGTATVRVNSGAVSSATAKDMSTSGVGNMFIGHGYGSGGRYTGHMYRVAMWNRKLTEVEIAQVKTILTTQLGF